MEFLNNMIGGIIGGGTVILALSVLEKIVRAYRRRKEDAKTESFLRELEAAAKEFQELQKKRASRGPGIAKGQGYGAN